MQETKRTLEHRIAERVLEAMEDEGLPPWEKAWSYDPNAVARNFCSGRPYRGINVLLTELTRRGRGYGDPRWLTYKQAQGEGRQVRRGERSTMIVFWKFPDREAAKERDELERMLDAGSVVTAEDAAELRGELGPGPRRAPLARLYNVFNVEQTDGDELPGWCEEEFEPEQGSPEQRAEEIVRGWGGGPEIRLERGNMPPRYMPGLDRVLVPEIGRYGDAADYYTSVFHELVHATGHESRLGRPLGSQSEMHQYGREEMVAGMGAAMLAGRCGFRETSVQRDAAYVEGWRRLIDADRSAVIYAAQKAQQACDLILGESPARPEAAA